MAAPSIQRTLGKLALSLALFISPGCTESDSSQLSANHFQQPDSLMPTDIWLNTALNQINFSPNPDSIYEIYASLDSGLHTVIMQFNTRRELKRAVIDDGENSQNTLVFDKGRITYSEHLSQSGQNWIIAYANNKPYAAAISESGSWKAIEPYVVPTNQDLLNRSKDLALRYASREMNMPATHRVLDDFAIIKDNIGDRESIYYYVNARKGDRLNIDLSNASSHIFFTFANQSASRMEFRNWSGTIDETGDLIIQVFAATKLEEKTPFTLSINRQILAGLQ